MEKLPNFNAKSTPLLRSNPYRWVAVWIEKNGTKQEEDFIFEGPEAPYTASRRAYKAASELQHAMRLRENNAFGKELFNLITDSSDTPHSFAKSHQSKKTSDPQRPTTQIEYKSNNEEKKISGLQYQKARKFLMLTREDMAHETGLSITSIFKIEKGIANPRRSTLARIEDFFKKYKIIFNNDGKTFQQVIDLKEIRISSNTSARSADYFKSHISEHLLKFIRLNCLSTGKGTSTFNMSYREIEILLDQNLSELSLEWLLELADQLNFEISLNMKIPYKMV
ncbi:helix-turn-helix domain-containing protein [Halomonas sp. 3A7M]|uniref:helix-turn-helix domain-containing protein n=1 Tax=Halomonas sp. 3A7M TaxID=2742616 RepID=UPI0018676A93|nr:helix-turn-helix transcriptional regulator [Halomonas sp. 3A7M]